MGELIRTNRLGQTTDADTPEELARTLESITREGIQNFDPDSANNFARRNSASAFAALITETLIAGRKLT
jgi:hypothetical protein